MVNTVLYKTSTVIINGLRITSIVPCKILLVNDVKYIESSSSDIALVVRAGLSRLWFMGMHVILKGNKVFTQEE